jgi:hypothetical protein
MKNSMDGRAGPPSEREALSSNPRTIQKKSREEEGVMAASHPSPCANSSQLKPSVHHLSTPSILSHFKENPRP